MNRTMLALVLMSPATQLACANRTTEPQCYAADPRGVWHADDLGLSVETYCDRGSSRVDGTLRLPIFHCIPRAEEGCDPCALDRDEVDAILLDEFMERAALAECPNGFGPTEVVRGCFAELVEAEECCWTSEFFYDYQVCDPGPQTTYP